MNNELTFTFVRNPENSFSLTPETSDLLPNMFVLDHLIATLFKVSGSGTPEPSSVQSYTTSDDKKLWRFKLKDNIFDSKGIRLTPSYWCEGIKSTLKRHPSFEKMILLSSLSGWSDFLKSKTDLPISCNDQTNEIILKFDSEPDGILEYLAMPALGFWKYLSESTFVETGTFKLKSFTPKEVIIEKKTESNKLRCNIRALSEEEITRSGVGDSEIVFPFTPIDELSKTSRLIKTSPTKLIFLEMNPYSSNFKDIESRKHVAGLIKAIKNNLDSISAELTNAESLYFDVKSSITTESTAKAFEKIKKLNILYASSKNNKTIDSLIKNLSNTISEETIYDSAAGGPDYREKVVNRKYDIRIGAVDAGTFPDKWVSEMMFCSKQGISFIDFEDQVCKMLTNEASLSPMESGTKINQILSKSVTLIPLYNSSHVLYVGNRISSHISANSPLVRLDMIEFK
jgi:hypothetical protein